MSATRLDGKVCAEALEERLKQRILDSKLKPHLAVIIAVSYTHLTLPTSDLV